jgi:preprotein translocase subunit SecG
MPSWMKWTIAILIGLAIVVVGFRWAGPLLTVFYVMNCLVLIIVVLLQSGKAADLAGAFGGAGSQTAFGPRGAATILSQATTWCAIMFMICALALVLRTDKAAVQGGSVQSTCVEHDANFIAARAAATRSGPAEKAVSDIRCSTYNRGRSIQGGFCVVLRFCRCRASARLFRFFFLGEPSGLRASLPAARMYLSPLCGRGGTGRRTSLRGWR